MNNEKKLARVRKEVVETNVKLLVIYIYISQESLYLSVNPVLPENFRPVGNALAGWIEQMEKGVKKSWKTRTKEQIRKSERRRESE